MPSRLHLSNGTPLADDLLFVNYIVKRFVKKVFNVDLGERLLTILSDSTGILQI